MTPSGMSVQLRAPSYLWSGMLMKASLKSNLRVRTMSPALPAFAHCDRSIALLQINNFDCVAHRTAMHVLYDPVLVGLGDGATRRGPGRCAEVLRCGLDIRERLAEAYFDVRCD